MFFFCPSRGINFSIDRNVGRDRSCRPVNKIAPETEEGSRKKEVTEVTAVRLELKE